MRNLFSKIISKKIMSQCSNPCIGSFS